MGPRNSVTTIDLFPRKMHMCVQQMPNVRPGQAPVQGFGEATVHVWHGWTRPSSLERHTWNLVRVISAAINYRSEG